MNAPVRHASPIRLSADVGGTFTDVAAFDEATGELKLGKTLTTPERLVTGIESGRRQGRIRVRRGAAVPARHHGRDQHHPGAQRRARALITTQGFRDIYEIGRVNRPESYNLFFRSTRR